MKKRKKSGWNLCHVPRELECRLYTKYSCSWNSNDQVFCWKRIEIMYFLSFCCRLYVALKVVLRLIFVILNNIYCIPTYCVWMLMLLPFRKLYPSLYWKMEGLFFNWLLAMVTMWSWTAGYDRKSYVRMKELILKHFIKY